MATQKIRLLVRRLLIHYPDRNEELHLQYVEGYWEDGKIRPIAIYPFQKEIAGAAYCPELTLKD